jgi:diguanylate cyclase
MLPYAARVSAVGSPRGAGVAARPRREFSTPRVAYAALGVLLVAYLISLLARGNDQRSQLLDGWLVAAFEIVAASLCLLRAAGPRRGRAIPLVVGCALLCWATGDVALTAESRGGATPPAPSLADAFYLGFYPLLYAALVLLMHRQVRNLAAATWLDGLVAGLGAAGVCACFAFSTILSTTGGGVAAAATNLAYPIGDVLLLMLVVGGTAILPGRRSAQWILLAGACALNAVGDTFNLFQASIGASHIGTVLDGVAWPTSILILSLSVWVRPPRTNPALPERAAGFLFPGLGAASGVAILLVGSLDHVATVAVGLATATLLVVGLRMTVSLRRLRALTEKRHRQAVTDDLTGLGNRRELFNLLDAYFANAGDDRRERRHLAFLFVDLDHFKEINDSFGHSAGDQLLRQLGPRLRRTLRGGDMLVRVGGDELGVVIMDTNVQYAISVAQRLTASLAEPFVLEEVSVRISASIGIASSPGDASDSASLLRCADLAMYRAKLSSSPYEVYRAALDDGGNRLRLVEELRVAVDSGAFVLHYQPQLDLTSGEITAIEALLRWPHPRLELVPPLDFLPLAEEAGLMPRITAFVLDRALAQCAAWEAAGRRLPVSVNVSVTDLLDPGFVARVAELLERHRLSATSLTLEITETTIIRDFEACRLVIEQVRALGVGVSIDDFGAGFTSLAHLGSLAVSELKLDRTFVSGLAAAAGGRDVALVRATIELGHALGLRVVAEGIEDAATLDSLAHLGCDVAQGYFISRPMPAEDLVLDRRPEVAELPQSVA